MGEPTTTLQILRRAIAAELQMPFAKRFRTSLTVDAGSTVSRPVDAALTQDDDFWAGQWFYHVTSQSVRYITSFLADDDALTLESDLAAITTNDAYEIHSIWTALEIHDAINRAIRQVGRMFPDSVEDETLIYQEDTLDYTVSGLTKAPWHLSGVWIERADSVRRGTATSADATHIVDTSANFSDLTTSHKVSIYKGTGAGQIRAVVSGTSGGSIEVATWTTTPDTTSKYAVWNPTVQRSAWYKTNNVQMNTPEFPDTIRLGDILPDMWGMRLRLAYDSMPSELSAEADATTVNKEYLIAEVCSNLHGQVIGDNRYDRELHYGEHVRYAERALQVLSRVVPRQPSAAVWQEGADSALDQLNPLGWR